MAVDNYNGHRNTAGPEGERRQLSPKKRAERLKRRRRKRMLRRLRAFAILLLMLLLVVGGIGYAALRIMDKKFLTLELPQGKNFVVQYGEEFEIPEAKALYGGSIFNKKGSPVEVQHTGNLDLTHIGTYTINYTVSHKGLEAKDSCSVQVVDTQAPVINLVSNADYYTATGMEYVEEGFTAVDNYDGDITDLVERVEEDGKVTYTVTDSNGNTAQAVREIVYTDKIVYLTFDDGPGQYTEELLDVLSRYDAKVTFFVTNQFPKYVELIGREAQEGHAIAIHSYTHDFAQIYKSAEAFWADIDQMGAVCESLTGVKPTIFRFPGGSGNTASRKFCEGVMTTLVNECSSKGYQYADWNVNSGDADGETDPDAIAENIIAGLKKHGVSIVLQHDIKKPSVEAVAKVLEWGKENGYVFLPMTETSFMYHGPTIRN